METLSPALLRLVGFRPSDPSIDLTIWVSETVKNKQVINKFEFATDTQVWDNSGLLDYKFFEKSDALEQSLSA